ncbi:hypothetical protein MBH78_21255 [Oceanimonas sp. NS1]|nr:hypothetical protein [Oceanimonas sp. NS1]
MEVADKKSTTTILFYIDSLRLLLNHRMRNHYLKSAYRPKAVKSVYPHRPTLLPGSKYINTAGESLVFTQDEKDLKLIDPPTTSGISYHISDALLRVHYYVVKSKEEFIKKKYKGDAMREKYI